MSIEAIKMAFFCGTMITAAIGFLMIRDAQRLEKHIGIARDLIDSGMDEAEAMNHSGCNHWDRWFVLRFWQKYPTLRR